jgi:hypothetical protein
MNRLHRFALRTLLAAAGVAGLAGAASAHDGHRDDRYRGPSHRHEVRADTRVDLRQDRQMDRIRDGAQSGRLTPHETRRLMRQQSEIRRFEAQARADGHVSWRERERLESLQDRARLDIDRQLRDHQTW